MNQILGQISDCWIIGNREKGNVRSWKVRSKERKNNIFQKKRIIFTNPRIYEFKVHESGHGHLQHMGMLNILFYFRERPHTWITNSAFKLYMTIYSISFLHFSSVLFCHIYIASFPLHHLLISWTEIRALSHKILHTHTYSFSILSQLVIVSRHVTLRFLVSWQKAGKTTTTAGYKLIL